MILAKGVECILCNINGVSNILIGQGRIEEMVVVARKEYAALDHLGDPLLMKHEGIVIGKGGATLKKAASQARADMEALLDCKVNLKLWVKVKKDWRDSDFLIKNFGYRKTDYEDL